MDELWIPGLEPAESMADVLLYCVGKSAVEAGKIDADDGLRLIVQRQAV